jgi:hypothetical protein
MKPYVHGVCVVMDFPVPFACNGCVSGGFRFELALLESVVFRSLMNGYADDNQKDGTEEDRGGPSGVFCTRCGVESVEMLAPISDPRSMLNP